MELLKIFNEKLSKHNLKAELRLNVEEKDIKEGKDRIYCDKPIKSQLVLIKNDRVVIEADTWETLLRKIQTKYGTDFMEENYLYSLKEHRYYRTDREQEDDY